MHYLYKLNHRLPHLTHCSQYSLDHHSPALFSLMIKREYSPLAPAPTVINSKLELKIGPEQEPAETREGEKW